MQIKKQNGKTYITGSPEQSLILNERDAVDVIGFCGENEAVGIMLFPKNG